MLLPLKLWSLLRTTCLPRMRTKKKIVLKDIFDPTPEFLAYAGKFAERDYDTRLPPHPFRKNDAVIAFHRQMGRSPFKGDENNPAKPYLQHYFRTRYPGYAFAG